MLGFDDDYETLRKVLEQPDHLVVFFHLHKTAGTTVERALMAHYGDRALRCHNVVDKVEILKRLREGKVPKGGALLYGHFAYECSRELEPLGYRPRENLFRFTFLRHPIERLESWYAFMKLRDPLLDDSLDTFMSKYRKNTAAKFFDAEEDPAGWLRNGVDFVGICEAMDTSLALLFQLLDIPATTIESYNVNASRSDRLTPLQVETFLNRFRKEHQLYEMARAGLAHSVARHLKRGGVSNAGVATQARATTINADLEQNKDPYSLYITGVSLFETDQPQAMAFFRKLIQVNPGFASRVEKYLRPRNKVALARLNTQVKADHADVTDPSILQMIDVLKPAAQGKAKADGI